MKTVENPEEVSYLISHESTALESFKYVRAYRTKSNSNFTHPKLIKQISIWRHLKASPFDLKRLNSLPFHLNSSNVAPFNESIFLAESS